MIYLTSDWHFNHDKEFIWQVRGFNSVVEMNEEIIKKHNSIVKPEDDVYVLGDLCMGGDLEANKALIEKLNGKLHIVFGNHDTANRQKMYLECSNVLEICGYATILKYQKYTFYLSHYPTNTNNYDDEKPFCCRVINICGHTHTFDKHIEMWYKNQLTYHVEMEAHNYFPVSLDYILADLKGAF